MDKAKELFKQLLVTGIEFAESVKRNIVHDGVIDDETVIKLNRFIIAMNELEDLKDESKETNKTLN